MKIIFANDAELEVLSVKRSLSSIGGMVRERMTVTFPLDGRSIDTLYGMFSEDACSKITVESEEGVQILTDFVIRDSFRVSNRNSVDEVTVSMAQMTYIEKQLAKLGV